MGRDINHFKKRDEAFNLFCNNAKWIEPIAGDKKHVETNWICHDIWHSVMKNELVKESFPTTSFLWCNKQYSDQSLLFHLDIMTNLKSYEIENKGKRTKYFSCGLAALMKEDERAEWEKNYKYHIGNMAPIPWFEVTGGHSINGQTLHKSLDERWDLYLNVLRSQWNIWCKDSKLTFEDYMILTCQQMYYADIYKKIKDMRKISMKDIDEWNEIIRSNPDMDLVSFKPVKGHAINAVIKGINRLIYIRDKVIGIILDYHYKKNNG